jgi:hypothetical protein
VVDCIPTGYSAYEDFKRESKMEEKERRRMWTAKQKLEVVLSFGAEIPFIRPDELATERTPSLSGIYYA